jgi:hypothetical protein
MDGDIVEPNKMLKGIWPKLGRESGATKHCTKGITNGLMWTFTWTILMRRVWSGGFDGITSLLKKGNDVGAVAKFTAKIETNIFVGMVNGQAMTCKPAIKEVNRRSL